MSKKPNPELIDDENPEWTKEMFEKARPVKDVFPELVELQKKARGRPKADKTKVSTTVRLDPEIIDFFKRGGRGWQTRMNDALKEYMQSH